MSQPLGPVVAAQPVCELPAPPPDPVAAHGKFAQKLDALEQLSSVAINPIPAIAVLSNLEGFAQEIEAGGTNLDRIIKEAASGKQLRNGELLAMQAGMYKYTQTIELLSKVVEQFTSGLKELLKTQV